MLCALWRTPRCFCAPTSLTIVHRILCNLSGEAWQQEQRGSRILPLQHVQQCADTACCLHWCDCIFPLPTPTLPPSGESSPRFDGHFLGWNITPPNHYIFPALHQTPHQEAVLHAVKTGMTPTTTTSPNCLYPIHIHHSQTLNPTQNPTPSMCHSG